MDLPPSPAEYKAQVRHSRSATPATPPLCLQSPVKGELKYLVIWDGAFARIRHPFFFPYRSYARASASDGPAACLLPLPRKTKTGKTPCAGCKMSLASHGRCSRLKIPRASSGILRRLQHPPIGFCIQRKAINKKNKPCPLRQETHPP